MLYPLMFRLGQRLHNPTLGNVPDTVDAELSKLNLRRKVKPGDTVAITCGSRAIANYAVIIKAIVDHLKKLKVTPFLVPAMGSHGGGTAEGQRELLHSLGITEKVTGAEIVRSNTKWSEIDRHCLRKLLQAALECDISRVA